MKLDVSDFDEIEVMVPHNCEAEETPEPYAAIEGSHDQGRVYLLECENCGELVPLSVGPTDLKAEMVEDLTAFSQDRQTREKRAEINPKYED